MPSPLLVIDIVPPVLLPEDIGADEFVHPVVYLILSVNKTLSLLIVVPSIDGIPPTNIRCPLA